MKKLFLMICFSFIGSSAIAISDARMAELCLTTAKAKILRIAESFGCTVRLDETFVQVIQNPWYRTSGYIWYAAPTDCGAEETISKMVRYYRGKCL